MCPLSAYKARRLERPCLPHVKYRYMQDMPPAPAGYIPPYNAGPGHVFTATEQLVNMHRSMSPSHAGSPLPAMDQQPMQPQRSPQDALQVLSGRQDPYMQGAFDHPFSMPKEQIDKLLETSAQLELETEVTPVQIWSRISNISTRFPIGNAVLQALKNEFMKYIRCNRC